MLFNPGTGKLHICQTDSTTMEIGRGNKAAMASYCCNSFPTISHFIPSDFFSPFKAPQLLYGAKRRFDISPRSSKVTAFYGLKTPPYKLDALEPYMSKRTIDVHWGEIHRNFVESLNEQLEKDDILYGYTMDELVKETYNNGNPLPEFNNTAEVWNHDFFWESMQPGGGEMPRLGLLQQIEKDFGSFTNCREKFIEAALTLFGSGWVWLVLKREERRLEILKTSNAICPVVWDDIHAYYLDYKNDRAKYVNVFMDHLVSWDAAMGRLARAEAFVNLGEPEIPVA
ncbi:superoxide dismutase [Fe] 3, chloroplastic isoform X2 [Prosopis cineraria]|uniref:superoxide dismutase [Fe] 3, chloroplastic isoform X2 n=1 Tax=Prosopis cineraria TaxID=364024 RepID=UPI00240FCA4A|nr:superoxide dismutase [Fe] 3, chloroplastic isoform X2 [Prosopis cineraria]